MLPQAGPVSVRAGKSVGKRSIRFLSAGVLFLAGSLWGQPATAQKSTKQETELKACIDKSQRLNDEANAATMAYVQKLAAQPRNSPWTAETCKALKISITLSDRRIAWQGQESRTCAATFKSPRIQQARAELRESNDQKKQLYRTSCR